MAAIATPAPPLSLGAAAAATPAAGPPRWFRRADKIVLIAVSALAVAAAGVGIAAAIVQAERLRVR